MNAVTIYVAGRWLMERGIGFGSELSWHTAIEVENILRSSDVVKVGGLYDVDFNVEVVLDRSRPVVVTLGEGETYPPPPPVKATRLDYEIEQAIVTFSTVTPEYRAKHILWEVQTWLAKGGGMGDCTEYMKSLSVAMERALLGLNVHRP